MGKGIPPRMFIPAPVQEGPSALHGIMAALITPEYTKVCHNAMAVPVMDRGSA